MVRRRPSDDFDAWITEVQHSEVKELRAFVKGLLKDAPAVHAGLSPIWSNGPERQPSPWRREPWQHVRV